MALHLEKGVSCIRPGHEGFLVWWDSLLTVLNFGGLAAAGALESK